ncbi:MAG: GMC oxidoreductase [Gemmatimonadaceae bacterium]
MTRRVRYDAIVVGSGMTGGWAAKELTEHGLNTLVLEAGRPIDPNKDYCEHVPEYQVKFRGFGDRKAIDRDQPMQKDCYACDEWSSKFFVNDHDNPYTTPDGKPFRWIRGRQVGGRSIMWGRQVYRWSDLDFDANAKEGVGTDWPIRYADIAPWYDYVERFIGISGQKENLPQLPDGQFMPPMAMNCVELDARDKILKQFNGERVMTIGRVAILTQNHNGRPACHYCGHCERGCVTFSYFSSINATLPAAQKTGRLTLRPFSVVESVLYDAKSDRVRGVRVVDANSKEELEFEGKVVFLCASAIESARLLLNSKSDRFPNGLANDSDQVGRNLMDHVMYGGANAEMPGFLDRTTFGNRPNGIYVARFRNVKSKHPDFLRGYGFQGGASRAGWDRGQWTPGFGADFKRSLINDPGPWGFWLGGFGEMLPNPENRVTIDESVKDKWGVPAARIACTVGENEQAMIRDMQITAAEMLAAAGSRDIHTYQSPILPGLCIHEMGTARMGRDPKTSVLNAHNQAHTIKNLFITDGACMASSANQNPSITYMALTARAVNYAVEAMKRREI